MVVEVVLDGSLSVVDHLAKITSHGAELALKILDLALQGIDVVKLAEVRLDVAEELVELVVALLVLLLVARDGAVDAGELVVGVLETVVQIHELSLGSLEDIGILIRELFIKLGSLNLSTLGAGLVVVGL